MGWAAGAWLALRQAHLEVQLVMTPRLKLWQCVQVSGPSRGARMSLRQAQGSCPELPARSLSLSKGLLPISAAEDVGQDCAAGPTNTLEQGDLRIGQLIGSGCAGELRHDFAGLVDRRGADRVPATLEPAHS